MDDAKLATDQGDGRGDDVFAEAMALIGGAQEAGIPVRLIGGLAVRYLTPDYPPRARDGQDLDVASTSAHRRHLSDFLVSRGYEGDRTFNALYGHKQLYFASPSGRTVDVLINRLRRKIERDPANPVYLQTARGSGYRLIADG